MASQPARPRFPVPLPSGLTPGGGTLRARWLSVAEELRVAIAVGLVIGTMAAALPLLPLNRVHSVDPSVLPFAAACWIAVPFLAAWLAHSRWAAAAVPLAVVFGNVLWAVFTMVPAWHWILWSFDVAVWLIAGVGTLLGTGCALAGAALGMRDPLPVVEANGNLSVPRDLGPSVGNSLAILLVFLVLLVLVIVLVRLTGEDVSSIRYPSAIPLVIRLPAACGSSRDDRYRRFASSPRSRSPGRTP